MIMDYHRLSTMIMDYNGLSWTIMDYHGLAWTGVRVLKTLRATFAT